MKIAHKITLGLLLLATLFGALTTYVFVAERTTQARMAEVSSLFSLSLDLNVPSVLLAQRLFQSVESVEHTLAEILQGNDDSRLPELVTELDAFERDLTRLRIAMRDISPGTENAILEQQLRDFALVSERFSDFRGQVIRVLEYHTAGQAVPLPAQEHMDAYAFELQNILRVLMNTAEQNLTSSRARAGQLIAGVRQAQFRTRHVAVVAAAAVFLLALLVAWVAGRSVTVPLGRMQRAVEEFSRLNWQTRVEYREGDELGVLAGTLNRMADQLGATTVSRDYVDAILQSLSGSVVVTDAAGTIESFNQAATAMFGVEWEHLFGCNISEFLLIPEETVVAEGNTSECLIRQADGAVLPVLYSRQSVEEEDGRPVRTVHVADDISALVAARQEADRVKEEFLAVVSHELRTPVTSILGSLKLVQSGAMGEIPPEAAEVLALAERNGALLVERVNELLDMQKLTAGHMVLALEDTDVRTIATMVVDTMQGYAAGQEVVLSFDCPQEPVPVRCDPGRIQQVLMNLLSNAVKFSPAGGIVEVDVQSAGTFARVSVRDDGPGIPEEFKVGVFDKFKQAKGSVTTVQGTGLGLAIAREIVLLHHGTIDFSSSPSGTTFWFTIPAVA